MENLNIHTIFFTEALICFLVILFFIICLKLRHNFQQRYNKKIQQIAQQDLPIYFDSYNIYQEILADFFHFYSKTNFEYQIQEDVSKAETTAKEHLTKNPHHWKLQLLLAKISFINNDTTTYQHLIPQIKIPFYAPRLLKASYYLLSAHYALYQTDMDKASADCDKALKIFKHSRCPYEQGECYLIFAQIYRISGFLDIAYTMLKEAEKIYKNLSLNNKIAEIQGYMGLLELNRENNDVALDYFQDALKLTPSEKYPQIYADLTNWCGIIYYLNQQKNNAEKKFLEVIKYSCSPHVQALALEMLSRIKIETKEYDLALKYTNKALKLNKDQKNQGGIFETLYLQAEIYFLKKEYTPSRKILSELINRKAPPKTTYYPANAYTLLGLIYLNQNNLNQADSYFKQAIDLENSRDRIKGALVDYNNLAETALRKGASQEAEHYLKQALTYAETLKDEKLITYLKNKLKT